jgi:hypothetical protein
MGAQMVREVASKTSDQAGHGRRAAEQTSFRDAGRRRHGRHGFLIAMAISK